VTGRPLDPFDPPAPSPGGFGERDPSLPERLAPFGVQDPGDLLGLAPDGTRIREVSRARTRRCLRLEDDLGVLFVKTQVLGNFRLPPRKWPSYLFRGSPVRREVEAAALLEAHGFRVPRYLACGERRGLLLPRFAWCVSEGVPAHADLRAYCAATRDPALRLRAADLADLLLETVHEKGLVLGGAKYRNLLVPAEGPRTPGDFVLLDQPDARPCRRSRARARDRRHLALDRRRYALGGPETENSGGPG